MRGLAAVRGTLVSDEPVRGGSSALRLGGSLPLRLLVFSLSYFAAAKIGIATALPPEGIVIIWPPNAVVVVALLATKPTYWWAFFIATVVTEVAADVPDYPILAAIGYGIINFSEGAFTAFLLSRVNLRHPSAFEAERFVRFILIGPVLASATAALFGAAVYKIGAPEVSYFHYWRVFWFGDALGMLVVGTALLTFRSLPSWWKDAGPKRALEAFALAAALIIAGAWAFYGGPNIPKVYAVFPFLLWAAVRFGAHGASLAVLLAIGLAVGSAADRTGPFAGLSDVDVVFTLQGLCLVVALSTFLLGFTIEDFWRANAQLRREVSEHEHTGSRLKRANQELEESNAHLDDLVAERTGSLERSLARNEVLLREIHHRVKNSLQMISAIVTLQGRSGTAQELSQKITKQVSAIAATYEVMHRMETIETADLCLLVSEICADLSDSAGGFVSLTCATEGEALVTADTAMASALALNELVTNSIKHSAGAGHAHIRVECRAEGNWVTIRIMDNGPGFPADFDIKTVQGFGLRMARKVVTRAGGNLQLGLPNDPAAVEIQLPVATQSSSV